MQVQIFIGNQIQNILTFTTYMYSHCKEKYIKNP
jgi:hypothetical protein